MAASDNEKSRLDEAARAGWLYIIAGHTQDEIAKMLQRRARRSIISSGPIRRTMRRLRPRTPPASKFWNFSRGASSRARKAR
jgi:hypothetical protein